MSCRLQNYNLIKCEPRSLDLQLDFFEMDFFCKALLYFMYFKNKVSFLQCALRMDSSGQNSIFKRQNRELDPFWPWWLVPAINRTARHTSQANMGSRDIHKLILDISFKNLAFSKTSNSLKIELCNFKPGYLFPSLIKPFGTLGHLESKRV